MKINITNTQKGILYIIPFGIMSVLAILQVLHVTYGIEVAIYFKITAFISSVIVGYYSIELFNKGLDMLGISKKEGMKH